MTEKEDLETRLKIAKSKLDNKNTKENKKEGIFLGNAFKLGTELVAAVAVGVIIGFILDNWFGTKPLLIILFFLFGSAAGIYNVIKTAKKMQENKE
jgi:ATP synthase protein I